MMEYGDYIREVSVRTAEGAVLSEVEREILELSGILVDDDGVWEYDGNGEPTKSSFFKEISGFGALAAKGSYIEMEGADTVYRHIFTGNEVEIKKPTITWE